MSVNFGDLGTSFKSKMDDGKDTTSLVAFGVEHSVETDFNSVPLKTGERLVSVHSSSWRCLGLMLNPFFELLCLVSGTLINVALSHDNHQ